MAQHRSLPEELQSCVISDGSTLEVLRQPVLGRSPWYPGLAEHIVRSTQLRNIRLSVTSDEIMTLMIDAFARSPHITSLQIVDIGRLTDQRDVARLVDAAGNLRRFVFCGAIVGADLLSAVVRHPSLTEYANEVVGMVVQGARIPFEAFDPTPISLQIRQNGARNLQYADDIVKIDSGALKAQNWRLLDVVVWSGYTMADILGEGVRERNRMMLWWNMHRALAEYCVALLPLRMPPYEMLWLLDWLPPMSHRFVHGGDNSYDPRHVQKVRLIEGLIRSYRAIKGPVE